jgi:CSLREA domain-containing protein
MASRYRVGRRVVGMAAVGALALPGAAGAATIKVDTLADGFVDNGKCGLREAIDAASDNAAAFGCPKGKGNERDTIVLKDKTYELDVATTNEANNVNGDLDVPFGGPLTVKGAGRGATSIFQSVGDRVFDVTLSFGDLTLKDLALGRGDVTGFSSSEARGGAVRTVAKLALNKVDVSSNSALVGGAVYGSSSAALKMTGTRLESNNATVGGAISTANSALATVKGSTFDGNDAFSTANDAEGGAINHGSTGALKIAGSTFLESEATSSGAGNTSLGGAIRSGGPLTIRGSLFSGNTTSAGTDNTQERGGAVYVGGGNARVVNSTFHGNHAGVVGDDGRGGAIFANSGNVTVEHVTFSGNLASDAGQSLASAGGAIGYFGSILAGSDPCAGDLLAGSAGFNVAAVNDPDCSLGSDDLAPATLGLGALGKNGGPTKTVPIKSGSDAKDFVPTAPCKEATGGVDQRGYKRPAGKRCDAGAFERGASKP